MTSSDSNDNATKYRYWAFISYSHQDEADASRLHRTLESYRLPKRIVEDDGERAGLPKRLFPIFRDRDELPGSSDLGEVLRQALTTSRCLIVVCSPQASASKWVNEEIEIFNRLGRGDRIYCVIAREETGSGSLDEDWFPPALRGEPLACDFRKSAGRRRDAMLRLVAGIVGLRFDELKRRDLQRRRRGAIGGSIAAMILLSAIGGLSWFGLEQQAIAESRTLAVASVQATQETRNPVAGLELAISAAERSPTSEARDALELALEHQRSLVILEHNSDVFAASFSQDGSRILTCGQDAWTRVWDVATGQILQEFGENAAYVRSCAFSPDDSTILTLAASENPHLWDAGTGNLRAILEGHSEGASAARFSATGRKVVSAGGDGIARIWDLETGRQDGAVRVTDDSLAVAFLRAGDEELLAITEYGVASMWDWTSATKVQEFGDILTWVNDAVMSPDGERLLINNYQYRPYLWDLSNPARFIDGAMRITHVMGAAFSADGSRLALGGAEGFVGVFDTIEGFQYKRFPHPTEVYSLAFSPDGQLLVTAADAIRIWSTPVLGGGVATAFDDLRGHSGWVRIEGFAPGDSSKILTIGEEDHTVRVWDISAAGDRAEELGLASLSLEELLELARLALPTTGRTETSH